MLCNLDVFLFWLVCSGQKLRVIIWVLLYAVLSYRHPPLVYLQVHIYETLWKFDAVYIYIAHICHAEWSRMIMNDDPGNPHEHRYIYIYLFIYLERSIESYGGCKRGQAIWVSKIGHDEMAHQWATYFVPCNLQLPSRQQKDTERKWMVSKTYVVDVLSYFGWWSDLTDSCGWGWLKPASQKKNITLYLHTHIYICLCVCSLK